jgi:hypothetical protein
LNGYVISGPARPVAAEIDVPPTAYTVETVQDEREMLLKRE